MTDLTQQQQALLERYQCAHAAWAMAVNYEDDGITGAAPAPAQQGAPQPTWGGSEEAPF